MNGIRIATTLETADPSALDRADRAETASIRRFGLLTALRDVVDEAARRAEARLRLETALQQDAATPCR